MKKLAESGLCDELCLALGKTMPSTIEASVLTFLKHVFQNARKFNFFHTHKQTQANKQIQTNK